jgi:hypothetical protein
LSRSDVGLKGYYFRQTADIDCCSLSSWTDISFYGHYDGDGHTFKSRKFKDTDNRVFLPIFGGLSEKNIPLFNANLVSRHCPAVGGLQLARSKQIEQAGQKWRHEKIHRDTD